AETERLLTASTLAEPEAPANQRVRHVVPGGGGGAGTATDPLRGLAAADASARPGDLLMVHAGTYPGVFTVTHSGQPGRPIIWQAAGDGPAIIDAGAGAARRPGRAVSASETHDVWFEGLEIRGASFGLVGHDASRLVVRRCWFHRVDYAITCTRNDRDQVRGWFISDNLMEGPCTWPRSKGIEDPRAVQVTGTAMTVCHNRIRGFGDGLDTFPSPRVENIEFCYNDISECTDDGIEMDYSTRNTRCFANRLTNCFDGVSVQPVYGGPVCVSRNVLFNLDAFGPFKLHNSPSGALFIHNTSWRRGGAAESMTNERVRRVVWRNNLLLGTTGNYAFEALPAMEGCDFDYDGYGGGPWRMFLKWNGRRYATFGDMVATAPVERHAVLLAGNPFASGLALPPTVATQVDPRTVDVRLRADSNAIDAGQPLPGFGDRVAGRAPDLGAIEFGEPLPHYGPRTAR
ncbi:MAG: right-handed parallel beta-helix repeat-containing protein, partial [Armatimonadetes bacterium]|nr:right-handed parallel beta-helix repeat-containing protein [Armatimonadota bacterium]